MEVVFLDNGPAGRRADGQGRGAVGESGNDALGDAVRVKAVAA